MIAKPNGRARRALLVTAAGAAGGAVATLAMSVPMLAAGALGLMGTQPPRRVVDKVADELAPDATHAAADSGTRDAVASILHVAIGAVAGALLALGRSASWATRRPSIGPLLGAVFGLAFWALNYLALAPALNLLPPATRDRPGRPPVMVAAHLVYGLVAAVVSDALLARLRSR
jgi:hypothetical protein